MPAGRSALRRLPQQPVAAYSSAPRTSGDTSEAPQNDTSKSERTPPSEDEDSALARRFAELKEAAALAQPSKAASINHDDASNAFATELKSQLADRLASASFASEHAQAISLARIPSSAPKHARDIAGSQVWTGTESTEDAVLRMLVDSHKKMRGGKPRPQTVNIPVDLRPPSTLMPKRTGAARLASAKEKSMYYSAGGETAEERAQLREMLTERFQGPSHSVASVSTLMSLADQRIEDARARGQFENLPRGKPIERDHNASSPFIDTTEYFLNKMIQRQEVLPPWVEKQQELTGAVTRFRERLQREWLRFCARELASAGGDLDEKCRRAASYARAERRAEIIAKREQAVKDGKGIEGCEPIPDGPTEVFRSAEWLEKERSYLELSLKKLNDLTRSYNIIAPELAKKPYLSLEREMERCYRAVAGKLEEEIRQRALAPRKPQSLGQGWMPKSVFYEKQEPKYGFRELWRDWFGKGQKSDA